MDKMIEMSESAIRTNIEFYRKQRNLAAQKAIEARAEEMKWAQILALKQKPETALKNMLIDY